MKVILAVLATALSTALIQDELGPIRLSGDAAYRARYAGMQDAPAPALHAERWIGTPRDQAGLEGKVVLLDFWGVWCPPCVKSTAQLIRLHDLYASRGLVVIGVHTQARKDGVDDYLRKKGVPYSVMVDDDDETAEAYRVKSFPTAYVIDHRGVLRYPDIEVLEDGLFRGDVERAVRSLLDERDADLGPMGEPGFDTHFADDVAPEFAAAEEEGFAGFTVVQQRGRRLFERGSGLADREHERPWSSRTVSTLGSITKPLTAIAILQLQEEGRLRVDDPIEAFLSAVPEGKRGITLHQLLTHSSGLCNVAGLDDWDPIGRDDFLRRVFDAPLAFAPGVGYAYSNAGYSVLGAIIEVVTGAPYESYLKRAVLDPAGMTRTGYLLPDYLPSELATGYRDSERWGTVLERPMAEDGPYWALRANGGVHSCAEDVLRLATALLERKLLSEESLRAMWTAHVREGDGAATWYGYGWSLMRLPTDEIVAFHNGGNGVFYADLAIAAESETVVFTMSNVVADVPRAREVVRFLGERLLVGP